MGVPAWIQMCIEMVIEKYKLNNIHEIWPNLAFFAHGGVSFEPYKYGFEKLLGKPITYIETYLASEGFLAWQDKQDGEGMRLSFNQHIFFEFVPFDENNFDENGEMVENPQALLIHEVEENKDYAILISTAAGAWRYLIGDTIRFIDKTNAEIIITGRTKHFINVFGEEVLSTTIHSGSNKIDIIFFISIVVGVSNFIKFVELPNFKCLFSAIV